MDKNMINIDDLFKQRLSGGEEKERPGAWLNMRELLDQKMPNTAPVAGTSFNWKRMLGVISGVVAISAVSLGGYVAATKFRNDTEYTASTNNGTANNGVGRSAQLARIAANTGTSKTINEAGNTGINNNTHSSIAKTEGGSTSGGGIVKNEGSAGSVGGINKPEGAGGSSGGIVKNEGGSLSGGGIANNEGGTGSGGGIIQNRNNTVASNIPAPGKSKTQQTNTGSTNTTDNKELNVSGDMIASNTRMPGNDLNEANNNNNTDRKTNPATLRHLASGATTSGATASGNTIDKHAGNKPSSKNTKNKNNTRRGSFSPASAIGGSLASNKPASKPGAATQGNNKADVNKNNKQSQGKHYISKIQIRETYARNGKIRVDTISMGLVALERYIPTADETDMRPQMGPYVDEVVILPAASASVSKNDAKEEMVPLAKFRVSRSKEPMWDARRFEEMVQNAKMGMSGVRFYPGMLFGANTLLSGKNTMAGFQLGVSGTLSLNERWGIFSELKYVHRFNSGSTIDADSTNVTVNIQNGKNLYTVTPVTRSYSFPSISSLELPVGIRYSANRINVFLGVNYSYYFAMAASPFDVKGTPETTTVDPANNQPASNDNPGASKLKLSDFGSRYGVGYLVGVGYHLTPAINLDVRVAQPVWSNANTEGSRYVSQQIFTVPTMQLNFNYRFSSAKRIK